MEPVWRYTLTLRSSSDTPWTVYDRELGSMNDSNCRVGMQKDACFRRDGGAGTPRAS